MICNHLMKAKSLASAFALAAVLLSGPGFAESAGVNSVGDTLPVGAGGTAVLTITGSTKSAQFNGPIMLGNVQANPNLSWACNSSSAGSMRYNNGVFEGCNGTSWGPLGGSSFSTTTTFTSTNVKHVNTTGGAIFLSSLCPNSPMSSGYAEAVDFYVYDPAGNQIQVSHGRIQEGGSDGNFSAAPSASAIVPPGYSWLTTNCATSATASTAYYP